MSVVQLESGSSTLLEDGGALLLEDVVVGPTIQVSGKPDDRLILSVRNPDGTRQRIAADEPSWPQTDCTLTTALGGVADQAGGFMTADVSAFQLTAEPARLHKFADAWIELPDGTIVWEGRLAATPIPTAEREITASLIGHAAILADFPIPPFLGVENDLGAWIEPPKGRIAAEAAAGVSVNGAFQVAISEGGISIKMAPDKNVEPTSFGEVWFRTPGGQKVGKVIYIADQAGSSNMERTLRVFDGSDLATSTDSATLNDDLAVHTYSPSSAEQYLCVRDKPTAQVNKAVHHVSLVAAALFGDHGLPTQAISGTVDGLFFSDVLRYLLALYAPRLATELAGVPTIADSTVVSPRLAWPDPTTLRSILDDGLAVERDKAWAVWEGPTFHWRDRHDFGQVWRLRRSEGAQFIDSGATAEPDFNGAVVMFAGHDGITRWAGPPGSGADVEDSSLGDSDPENPVNLAGLTRYLPVELDTSDSDKAVEIGALALREAIKVRFAGEVECPRYAELDGRTMPTSLMRAGDRLVDADSVDGEEMLVIQSGYSRSSDLPMTATIDTPANRLDAAIAQLAATPRRIPYHKIRRRLARQRYRNLFGPTHGSNRPRDYTGAPRTTHSSGGYGHSHPRHRSYTP